MAALERAKGVCPDSATLAAQKQRRVSGPGEDRNVALGPHNRVRFSRRPAVCLSRGGLRVVPRVLD